jgi:vancomycin resistance protein YoaR
VALFVVAFLTFGVDRFLHRGEALRGVEFVGESLEGLNEDGIRAVVGGFEDGLVATPALFTVNDREFALDPQTVGFSLDTDAVIAEAMSYGRTGGPLEQLGNWLGSFGGKHEVDFTATIDPGALEIVLDDWETDAIDVRVSNGSVSVRGPEVVVEYPVKGLAIDRVAARDLVTTTLASSLRAVVTLPLDVVEPSLVAADIDAAAEEARLLIASSVVLVKSGIDELRAEFTAAQLAGALRSSVEGTPPRLELRFDPEAVEAFLTPLRGQLELPPRDAEYRINDDDTVTLIPSRPGTLLDAEDVAAALVVAAKTTARRGELPIRDGVAPEFSTEDAEALGPITKVSEFTTNHACCEPRVTNIQLFADLIDGTIVQPGETFSLNEAVGERTADAGFVMAPMIQGGELVPDIGGGVSQFATTFYNAVFFGGYEDVEHTPHSIYISRYPELREATISWPNPGLIFRNDTDSIVLIDTSYTDTSITVKFFGNNGGRRVDWELGGRFNFTDPVEDYVANEAVTPGDQIVRSGGSRGWSVSGTQTITYPDGTVVEHKYTHRYRGAIRQLEVHPCDMPGATIVCPIPVPAVVGVNFDAALAAANAVGLTLANGGFIEVTIESGLNGLIAQQTPAAGELAPPGTAITVLIGLAPPPPTTVPTTAPPTTPPTTAPPTTPPTTIP